ncbi:MAG: PD40 domain-containing protein [Burkholderiales bacterium]|nr:PD40 domain-containing protein [Bacteroidia bacterium]
MRLFLFLFIILIGYSFVYSQSNLPPGTYSSTNKKAVKYFEESKKMFQVRKDAEAEKLIKKAIEEDPQFIEAHSAYADFLMGNNRVKEAIPLYEKAIQINPKIFIDNNFYLGGAYLHEALYDKAIPCFEVILKTERINPNLKDESARYLKNARFGSEAIKHPQPFKPVNVGEGINTREYEYFPALTADGNTFLFTRNIREGEGVTAPRQEDFYISKKVNNVWQTANPMPSVNTPGNEGAPSLSADGEIMFFASCMEMSGDYGTSERKGYGSCDIFYAQKINGKWTKPRNAGAMINTKNWETQPSFSSDGKTLYFIRGMVARDGIKNPDVYSSTIGSDGKFSEPVKLSDNINTPLGEESVFIHPDNQTLYFSSEGHPGMGGLDIFFSKKQADGSWGKAVNLGYPLNTFTDENSLVVDANGKLAYLASERDGGFGGLDIYQFELPESLRPEVITYVKGHIFNARTRDPLEASFELIDLETQQSVTSAFSNSAGEFLVTLTSNHNYLVNVSKPGFLFYSDNFSLKDKVADYNKPFKLEIPLQPIDTGIIELKNIFFDVNKWDLKAESKAELQKIIAFLKANPTLKVEFSGHTDNSGDKVFNKTLSNNRAKAIYDYVIEKGPVPATNLSYKGYGDSKPKAPNDTPENKAKNRRTELKILSK